MHKLQQNTLEGLYEEVKLKMKNEEYLNNYMVIGNCG